MLICGMDVSVIISIVTVSLMAQFTVPLMGHCERPQYHYCHFTTPNVSIIIFIVASIATIASIVNRKSQNWIYWKCEYNGTCLKYYLEIGNKADKIRYLYTKSYYEYICKYIRKWKKTNTSTQRKCPLCQFASKDWIACYHGFKPMILPKS